MRLKPTGWGFDEVNGSFTLREPQESNYLYFPLVNEAGMMSSITPNLHGDVKSSHHHFLTPPVSVEDLHNSRASRNFWVYVEGKGVWSAAGNSAVQNARRFGPDREETVLQAGFLWHRVTRTNSGMGLQAEITSFVPVTQDKVELMQVTLTNIGSEPLLLTPTAAIPLYARSADDLRDHRHVTSLLHRVYVSEYGLEVQPALSFDERSHRVNRVTYSVFGSSGNGEAPVGFFPVLEDFIGEGGSLDWPQAVVEKSQPAALAGDRCEGYEAVGGLRFQDLELKPGEAAVYTIALAVTDDRPDTGRFIRDYVSSGRFEELLKENERVWQEKVGLLRFCSADASHDQWMKWVTVQPVFRRLMGNSFLPYHDYGRGGRGWRDLWQDCLALLFMEPSEVRNLLYNNFAGVRMDGSNATIIGAKPGEFIADRNNIPRVWMDHGAWPLLTVMYYLHQSGDLDFLLEEQTYFKDIHIKRCKAKDEAWTPAAGSLLRKESGEAATGTILEHLLLQNLVPFFHVGEHNVIRLEGADWNDGLDMAAARGESVAFTAFYESNLRELAGLLRKLEDKLGLSQIEVAEEMKVLFDTWGTPVDYESASGKRDLLERYYNSCSRTVSGRKSVLAIARAASDLEKKADWLAGHLRRQEWVESKEGYAWYNGYYNNDGERVEGDHPSGVRMTLTGQVFPVMGGTATDEQVKSIVRAVDRYLLDERIGYRLNSNFGGIQQNLGRAFGFAFGHKENGAMFSHMAVMYANGLYRRGFVREGRKVLDSIYALSTDFANSRMYPGVPEYINERGRGMYTYLTGSASWLLLTELTEVYGVRGYYGDLLLEPKLLQEQFDREHQASVTTLFAGRSLTVVYRNPHQLDYGRYKVGAVHLDDEPVAAAGQGRGMRLERELILNLARPSDGLTHVIVATLQAHDE
ncbi:MAG: cellobiose phosphorylase [Paenibacillaceae bacterium]|nr:cellobiose phosphorylase [Paenibacillaceae bacterium]